MEDDSAFFGLPGAPSLEGDALPQLIHRSAGGWCELYRIIRDSRFVAVKRIRPEFREDPRYQAQLRKEYEIGRSLSHPSVCEMYAFRSSPEWGPYIEMEWIDGYTLGELLAGGLPSRPTCVRLVSQLCEALAAIHAHQIIHRDIKPSNLMVTRNGANLKVIDFGMADADSWSALKTPGGTQSFAAPELLAGEQADCRADIYSLGKVIGLLMPDCRRVSARCTETDPARRYPDAGAVWQALERRRRRPLLAAAVALPLLALGAALGLMLSRRPVEAPLPEDGQETLLTDPSAIDELFRQATEMVLSEEDH